MFAFEDIQAVVHKIIENSNPTKIILFGSYAYGNPTENSDIDLLIIKNTGEPLNKRSHEIRRYLREIKMPMDILVYTEDEYKEQLCSKYSFISHLAEKGKVLYG